MVISKDALMAKAKLWTQPISAEAPAGKPAKLESAYDEVQKEVSKLDSASAGSISSVNWDLVVNKGGEVLEKLSKDLLVASYVSYGLYATSGFEGLATGLSTLSDLMEQYWPSLFPEVARIRGRANALGWLVGRLGNALPSAKVTSSDKEALEALSVATARMVASVKAKFENNAPALSPLVEAVERLKAAVPVEASKAQVPESPAKPEPAAASALPTASPDDPAGFLRQVGTSLTELANALRRADPSQPLPYRLMRTGIWMAFHQAPPATASKTGIPPLPAATKGRLSALAANGKWTEVLEESESLLSQNRFNLDLQRLSAQALGNLGPNFAAARQQLVAEVAAFLKRAPGLPELSAQDGTPLADGETRAWLDAEVKSTPGAASANAAGGEIAAAVEEARALLSQSKTDDALALLQKQVAKASSGQERFRTRLELAKMCAAAGQKALAYGLFEGLDAEIMERGLDAWDPSLATQCLEGLLSLARSQGGKAPGNAQEHAIRYRRLCQLDPSAAMRVAP